MFLFKGLTVTSRCRTSRNTLLFNNNKKNKTRNQKKCTNIIAFDLTVTVRYLKMIKKRPLDCMFKTVSRISKRTNKKITSVVESAIRIISTYLFYNITCHSYDKLYTACPEFCLRMNDFYCL